MSPLRAALGRRLHAIVDARIAEKRTQWLQEPQVFGPAERLVVEPGAKVNDALFNTVGGSITVRAGAFFGHGVAVLTGTHDIRVRGAGRQDAIPREGRDVVIEQGAWVSSRAVILGPCTIGADAVVAAGAVVTGDVPAATVVAGVPARPVRDIDGEAPRDG